MSVGFVKSIAAMLVGTGFAMAQSPAPIGGQVPTRNLATNLQPPTRFDVTYPQAATQQGYAGPLPAETPNGLAVPEGGYGGTGFEPVAPNAYRVYADFECLLWNIRNGNLPPIVSNIPVGVINQPSTDTFISPFTPVPQVVVTPNLIPLSLLNTPTLPQQDSIDLGEHKGARLTIGMWFDADMDCGVEASGFILEKRSQNFRNSSQNTANQLTLDTGLNNRTFVLPGGGAPPVLSSSSAIAFPAQAQAALAGTIWTEFMGAELNARTSGYQYGMITFGGLLGVRYLQFEEGLTLSNSVALQNLAVAGVPAATFLPVTFMTADDLRTHNYIIAPQVGLKAETYCYGLVFSAQGKVAVGANIQEIETIGSTTQTSGAFNLVNGLGGLLSGPADQNDLTRARITVVPEVNLKLGYQCGQNFRFWIGYDALYMQHVIRPGDQTSFTTLNTNISLNNNPGSLTVTQPTIRFRDLDVWVQGINFGFELRY